MRGCGMGMTPMGRKCRQPVRICVSACILGACVFVCTHVCMHGGLEDLWVLCVEQGDLGVAKVLPC
jgi:hypothetical protein